MSAFLWVEDFEGGQYREFSHTLFGRAMVLEAGDFPEDESGLRDFMKSRQVELATSFAEAARRIDENLRDFDYVVLDIDLNLLGEDTNDDRPWVDPVLERWYGYDPNAENEEVSFNAARQKMKGVAGYHLFIDLVMNRGFPRERILFCSNHGNHLDSINNSFEPARMEAPPIYKKGDTKVKEWIAAQAEKPYLKLRRWVIIACREINYQIMKGETEFVFPELQKDGTIPLTQKNIEQLLETLPCLLPEHETKKEKQRIAFRLFARTLAQDWDKVSYTKENIPKYKNAFSDVLVRTRHWTSHDAEALSVMDEGFVASLFLIAMRSSFNLPEDNLEGYEAALLSLIGDEIQFDMNEMKEKCRLSNDEISNKYARLPEKKANNYFSSRVSAIQECGRIRPEEQPMLLYQIIWHRMQPHQDGFSPAFVNHFMRRIYKRSFPL